MAKKKRDLLEAAFTLVWLCLSSQSLCLQNNQFPLLFIIPFASFFSPSDYQALNLSHITKGNCEHFFISA